jgi:hypothetical protein
MKKSIASKTEVFNCKFSDYNFLYVLKESALVGDRELYYN